MGSRLPALASTYVRVAKRLARRYPTRPISAGEVAWHAHARAHYAGEFDLKADIALEESGLFERASFVNGNRFGVTLWRIRNANA